MPRGWASCCMECRTGLTGSWVASSGGTRSLQGPRAPCSLCCILGTPPAFLSHCQPPRAGQRACWGPPGSQLGGGVTRLLWDLRERSSATSEWPGATGALLEESRRKLAT